MRIDITEKHILNGRRESPHRCAVALALAEAFETDDVCVDNDGITINGVLNFEFPEKVKTFIKHFDSELIVAPLSFELHDNDEDYCRSEESLPA